VTQNDNPTRGIAIIVLAQALFSVTDAIAKVMTESVPTMTIVWTRFLVFVICLTPLVVHQPRHLAPGRDVGVLVFRALLTLASTFFMTLSVARLSLTTATTLMFVGPFFVTALSVPLLGERVGWRRWLAVIVGFSGILLIVRPGTEAYGIAVVFALASTACWSLGIIITRKVSGRIDALTLIIWQAMVSFVVAAPFAWAGWTPPTPRDWAFLIANGAINLVAQWLTVRALQVAPASTLAPMSYTLIVWATALGYLIYGTLPDTWTWAGAAIIIAGGLYVWHRERVRQRETALEQARGAGLNADLAKRETS
jgi:drug/metabolite transporter (DMT)-like permease